jgi:LacI family repressor for deo operon, udp, cdd, tsx, nupC, and nupG
MREENKAVREFLIMHGDFSIQSGAAAAEHLLGRTERPTAVFCFNDEMAMGVLEVARRLGIGVPNQLSVAGFDDIRFAQHIVPPLTTIAQPIRQIGEGTVHLLAKTGLSGIYQINVVLPPP